MRYIDQASHSEHWRAEHGVGIVSALWVLIASDQPPWYRWVHWGERENFDIVSGFLSCSVFLLQNTGKVQSTWVFKLEYYLENKSEGTAWCVWTSFLPFWASILSSVILGLLWGLKWATYVKYKVQCRYLLWVCSFWFTWWHHAQRLEMRDCLPSYTRDSGNSAMELLV